MLHRGIGAPKSELSRNSHGDSDDDYDDSRIRRPRPFAERLATRKDGFHKKTRKGNSAVKTKVIGIAAIVIAVVISATVIVLSPSPKTFCELTGVDRMMADSVVYGSTLTPIPLNDINAIFSGTFLRVYTSVPDDAEQLTVYGQDNKVLLTVVRSDDLYVIDGKTYRLTYTPTTTNADVAESEDAAVL